MSPRVPPVSTVLLGGLVLGLLAGVGLRLWGGTQAERLLATAAHPAAILKPVAAAPAGTASVASLKAHALFYRSRTYYPAPPPEAAPAAPPPVYELLGVMMTPTKGALAIIRHPGESASHTVHPGEELEGWQVQSIEDGKVVLTHDGQQTPIVSAPRAGLVAATMPGAVTTLGAGSPVRAASPPGGAARPLLQPRLFVPPAPPPHRQTP